MGEGEAMSSKISLSARRWAPVRWNGRTLRRKSPVSCACLTTTPGSATRASLASPRATHWSPRSSSKMSLRWSGVERRLLGVDVTRPGGKWSVREGLRQARQPLFAGAVARAAFLQLPRPVARILSMRLLRDWRRDPPVFVDGDDSVGVGAAITFGRDLLHFGGFHLEPMPGPRVEERHLPVGEDLGAASQGHGEPGLVEPHHVEVSRIVREEPLGDVHAPSGAAAPPDGLERTADAGPLVRLAGRRGAPGSAGPRIGRGATRGGLRRLSHSRRLQGAGARRALSRGCPGDLAGGPRRARAQSALPAVPDPAAA